MIKILIVEDDLTIHNLLKELLLEYKVIDAYSGTEALMILEKEPVDLILLDLMLPGLNGEEIIKRYNHIPIIVLSAKISSKDKVTNLLNGASDYLTKPFDNDELLARIKVQLRNKKDGNLNFKELTLKTNHNLLINNKEVKLTKTEYAILKQLLINKENVISKSLLLELISMDTQDCDELSLKVHISNLKKKISKYTSKNYIESVWGIGYKLIDE